MINKLRIKARANNSSKSKAKAKQRRSMAFMSSKQQGFTLIELLVVVSILAALAGLASVAMDGYQQDAEEKITRVEMQRIAGAIRRFKADTGYWPKTGRFEYSAPFVPATLESYHDDYYSHAIDFSWLFYPPTVKIAAKEFTNEVWGDNDAEISEWQIDNSIGWHGPYIDIPAAREIVAGTNCQEKSNADMTTLLEQPAGYPITMKSRSIGIVDRFERDWRRTAPNGFCVTTRDQDTFSQYVPDHISGSPYIYETAYTNTTTCSGASGCIALRSLGRDSGIGEDDDDIVLVLKVN